MLSESCLDTFSGVVTCGDFPGVLLRCTICDKGFTNRRGRFAQFAITSGEVKVGLSSLQLLPRSAWSGLGVAGLVVAAGSAGVTGLAVLAWANPSKCRPNPSK